MYREITQRNVAAALQRGVRDPEEIAGFNFWAWARAQGLSTRESVENLLGNLEQDGYLLTPWELRVMVESHSPEERARAEQRALHDIIRNLGHSTESELEAVLGHSISGMSTAAVQAEVRALWAKLAEAAANPTPDAGIS